MRDQLGELIRLAVTNDRDYGMVACEKEDGTGLVMAAYVPEADPAIMVAKLGFTAALCRLAAGGQILGLVLTGMSKRHDPDADLDQAGDHVRAVMEGKAIDPTVVETAIVALTCPDAPTVVWMAKTRRDDFGIVDLEWTDVSAGRPTAGHAWQKSIEVLEILTVNFPVASNVEAVAEIMDLHTAEVSYR